MNARVQDLPRRDWRETADVEGMTARLRTSAGTQRLRPIQAAALAEAEQLSGLFLHGRVGCGKTLISALLPRVWQAKKPLIIVPGGGMVQDTYDEFGRLRQHWQIPRSIHVVGYEFLGKPQNAGWIQRYRPDAIIADEGHKLKAVREAVCAIEVSRYVSDNPHVKFGVMSGTLSPHGDLTDYAHLLIWALRKRAPIPLEPAEINQWVRAMSGASSPNRCLGAIDAEDALDLFRERLRQTPGVVISNDVFDDVPLEIEPRLHDSPEALRDHFLRLRTYWEAPDGWAFEDESSQFQAAACARQLANGFYYAQDPRPSDDFLRIRKRWTSACKNEIEAGNYDSGGQLKLAIRTGKERGDAATRLAEWEQAAENHPMRHTADWLAIDALQYAKQWAKPRGIIWVSHIETGEALEQFTGLPFFRGQPGRNVLNEDGTRCIIASISACGTGKNLQGPFERGSRGGPFYHNLIMQPPANGETIEQLIGRTHREGQTHPVTVEFFIACREQRNAVIASINAAEKIDRTLSPQKMTNAPWPAMPRQDHPAWEKAHRVDLGML